MAVFAVIFASAVTFSETAHAGLLSIFASILGSEQATAKISQSSTSSNSQNIVVLAAAINTDPNPEKPTEIAPIDGAGQTLVADIALANATSSDEASNQISVYSVHEGDTISSVAKMFKVSVNTILWANDLNGKSILKPGQTLVILPISGLSYTVKKGDTLKAIAKKYNADEGDILSYNDLSSSGSLAAGQTIIIPNAEAAAPVAKANPVQILKQRCKTKYVCESIQPGWDGPSYPGYYINPLPSGHESQGLHGKNAIDMAAPVGTSIIASAAGTVIINRSNGAYNGGYGNYVVISHANGTQTLYSHMSKSAVLVGQYVAQGQTIGYIGMTGLTTGPHVHFEIRGAYNPF